VLLGKSQVQQKKVLIRDFFNIRDFRELRMCDESMQTASRRRLDGRTSLLFVTVLNCVTCVMHIGCTYNSSMARNGLL